MRTINSFKMMLTIFLSVFFLATTMAQEMLSLGKMDLVQASPNVQMKQRCIISTKKATNSFGKAVHTGIGSVRYHARIGGVSFEAIARPDSSVVGKNINISYQPKKEMMMIKFDSKKYGLQLPSWQLVPILNYVESEQNEVVTIFNHDRDDKEQGMTYPLFNQAFIDNLLGLRLFQVDLMLAPTFMDFDEAWRVPQNSAGYVIANSEKGSVPPMEKTQEIDSCENAINVAKQDIRYSTYVYTDYKEDVTFGVNNGRFYIKGEPYYLLTTQSDTAFDMDYYLEETNTYITKAMTDSTKKDIGVIMSCDNYLENYYRNKVLSDAQIDSVANGLMNKGYFYFKFYSYLKKDIIQEADSILKKNTELTGDSSLLNYSNFIIELTDSSRNVWNIVESIIEDSTCSVKVFPDLERYYFEKVDKVKSYDYEIAYSYLICYSLLKSSGEVVFLEDEIHRMKEIMPLLYRYNPLVYDAAKATMQWAAFFRYIKNNYPSKWNVFYSKYSNIAMSAPDVYTPDKFGYKEKRRNE